MTKLEKQEAAEEQKMSIYVEQKGICPVCKKRMKYSESQAAHRIPKYSWLIKKYSEAVIHHRFNIKITHAQCNSAVMIMPESVPALELIKDIQEDLK